MTTRRVARVSRFGDAGAMVLATERLREPRGTEVVVRVTHASLGSTDLLARRGGYVFQPLPGFVTGYDFVGVLESESAVSVALGLRTGARVAGALPRMGAHATRLVLSPTFLVALPEGLDPAVAATLPLDALTASRALTLAGPARSLLVQGASGAVGSLAVQLAQRDGGASTARVIGTASARSREAAARLGIPLVDYTLPDWPRRVCEVAGGPVEAAIDHTGSPQVREALSPDGVLVHTAFVGRPGHERADSLRGGLTAARHARSRPREAVVSIPTFVLRRRPEYRRVLAALLADAAEGRLTPPEPVVVPLGEVWEAHRQAEALEAGRKVVLAP
jgi:NADPH:quinone reductase-like Zn-dependent oxidoreductase